MYVRKLVTIIAAIMLWLSVSGNLQVQADWAYAFVVYDGQIYVVESETLLVEQIGEKVGEVTHYSDREGTYNGNFSNYFPKGSSYYAIIDIPIDEAIAVQSSDGTYVRVNFEAPYARGSHNASDVVSIETKDAKDQPTAEQRQSRLLILLSTIAIVLLAVIVALIRARPNKR